MDDYDNVYVVRNFHNNIDDKQHKFSKEKNKSLLCFNWFLFTFLLLMYMHYDNVHIHRLMLLNKMMRALRFIYEKYLNNHHIGDPKPRVEVCMYKRIIRLYLSPYKRKKIINIF